MGKQVYQAYLVGVILTQWNHYIAPLYMMHLENENIVYESSETHKKETWDV